MSELILESEILNRILDGHAATRDEVIQVFNEAQKKPQEIFQTSQALRNEIHRKTVTFSKKAFFNLINLCKDTCTYCTYKAEPNEKTATMMS